MLKRLGFTKVGYIARNVERMKELDSYVTAYRAE